MIRKVLLLPLFLLILSVPLRAGDGVRGFVVDKTSGEPLPVANVVVKGTTRGAATNLDGFFSIPGLSPGVYTLSVSYLGYYTQQVKITVSHDLNKPVRIELTPESVRLEEVVYSVDDQNDEEIRQSPRVSTIPVDANTIRNMPSLGAEVDVLRAVQAIPGVKASSEMSSALYVRGGSADMTLITMDQSTVYNPSHLFGIFSTFNADAVKHLQLIKGGFPAEYGGRAGSVLDVVTNEGNRKKTEGLVSLGVVAAKAAIEGPLPGKRGSYALSGRRTYFEPVLNMMRNSSESLKDLPDYYFYDGNGKINLDLTSKSTLTLAGYLGLDNLNAEFGPEDSRLLLDMYWGNQTFASRFRQVMPFDGFMTFGMTYSRYRSGFQMKNEDVDFQEFTNRFHDLTLRSDLEYYGVVNHKFKTGIEAHQFDVEVVQKIEGDEVLNIDTTNWNIAHYLQDDWRINANWELMPGLRWYWHEDGNIFRLDPRLALMYHFDTNTRIKLAGGRYHQFVDVISSGEGTSFLDIWIPYDGSVKPTFADQLVFGFEFDPKPDVEFTFETYYNWLHNVHEFNKYIDRGSDMNDAFVIGKGYSYGFEWMLRKKEGRLTGWIGYSLSWTKRRFPGSYVNNGDWFYPKWDRRHDFIVISSYKLSNKWDVSTSWRYNTGQGYTRALGVFTRYYANIEGVGYWPDENRNVLYGSKNNYRLPADHRLDLTFTYNHTLFGKDAKLNISIYNAYNRRAIWFRNYDLMENPVEVSDVKLLPVLPMVSYELKF